MQTFSAQDNNLYIKYILSKVDKNIKDTLSRGGEFESWQRLGCGLKSSRGWWMCLPFDRDIMPTFRMEK